MKKRTLYMETTKKEPEETAGEIQKLLKDYGLSKFMADYRNGEIVGVMFAIKKGDEEIPYKMPISHQAIWKIHQETKYIRTEEQARRVAWRQVYRWIEAMLALVETQMVEVDEIFLPYMIPNLKKQLTVYDLYKSNGLKALKPGGEE